MIEKIGCRNDTVSGFCRGSFLKHFPTAVDPLAPVCASLALDALHWWATGALQTGDTAQFFH
jgi:hypothetical protein